jgi:hypothetical protein
MEWGLAITTSNPEEADKSEWIRRIDLEGKEVTVNNLSFKIVDGCESTKLISVESSKVRPVSIMDKKTRSAGIN